MISIRNVGHPRTDLTPPFLSVATEPESRPPPAEPPRRVLLFALPQYVSLPHLKNLEICEKSCLRRPRPPGSVSKKTADRPNKRCGSSSPLAAAGARPQKRLGRKIFFLQKGFFHIFLEIGRPLKFTNLIFVKKHCGFEN